MGECASKLNLSTFTSLISGGTSYTINKAVFKVSASNPLTHGKNVIIPVNENGGLEAGLLDTELLAEQGKLANALTKAKDLKTAKVEGIARPDDLTSDAEKLYFTVFDQASEDKVKDALVTLFNFAKTGTLTDVTLPKLNFKIMTQASNEKSAELIFAAFKTFADANKEYGLTISSSSNDKAYNDALIKVFDTHTKPVEEKKPETKPAEAPKTAPPS
jgi:hypothetical protein